MITLNLNPRTLPEARTEITNASAEITRLEAELTKAKETPADAPDVTKLQKDLVDMTTRAETAEATVADVTPKLEAATKKIGEIEPKLTEATEKIATFDKTLEAKSKEKAIQILGAKGLSPIELGLVDAQGEKPDRSKLKGTAKVAAAFKDAPELAGKSR